MIKLNAGICTDFREATSREWIETNGIGGYTSGTVSGANSRRYHGSLVAATKPPLGRMVLLSKFEETLIISGERYELSCNQYPGTVHPEGYQYLTTFCLDPFPKWTFDVNGIQVEKSLFMVHGENTTVATWGVTKRPEAAHQITIELKPLLAFRDHHHLRHEDGNFDRHYTVEDNVLSFTSYAEMPTLYLAHNALSVEHTAEWYRNFEYEIERERGFDYTEDLFSPADFSSISQIRRP